MFWNVDDYLDDYPNLKAIPKDIRESASIDGKLYGIPFQKILHVMVLLFGKIGLIN